MINMTSESKNLEEWQNEKGIVTMEDICNLDNEDLVQWLALTVKDLSEEATPTQTLVQGLLHVIRISGLSFSNRSRAHTSLHVIKLLQVALNTNGIGRGFVNSVEKEINKRDWRKE